MGIDRDRLRSVLQRGTGTVELRENLGGNWQWPGQETYERVVSGQVSDEALRSLQGHLGSPIEEDLAQNGRVVGEFWSGWTYTTIEVVSRTGKTKITARSRPSIQQLMPLFMIFGSGVFISIAFVSKKATDALPTFFAFWAVFLGIAWFIVGNRMRSNRGVIRGRLERVVESVRDEILNGSSSIESESVEDRLRN